MAIGDVAAEIVTSPITSGKIITAVDLVLANTTVSGNVVMAGFNQGRSLAVVSVE